MLPVLSRDITSSGPYANDIYNLSILQINKEEVNKIRIGNNGCAYAFG